MRDADTGPTLATAAAPRRAAAAKAPPAAGQGRRPVILTFVAHYLPGYRAGGAIRSVANLVSHLHGEFEFRIVAGDRDSGDRAPYPGATLGAWQAVAGAQVLYLAPGERRLGTVRRLLRDTPHDLLYLNSAFDPRFTTLPLLARRLGGVPRPPAILAPRGEFSPGALAIKPRRKRAFLAAAGALGLHRGLLWQASTVQESEDIRRVMGPVPVREASDLQARAALAAPPHPPRAPGGPLRLLFLSRLSPMKNLPFLLRLLPGLGRPVDLRIVGNVSSPGHWAECEALIRDLPPEVTVTRTGAVPPEAVPGILAAADLFVLPTLGENFGHVIAEALGAGTPALISDRTPWRDLARHGAGWVLPLEDPAAWAAAIRETADEPPEAAARRRAAALAYARAAAAEGEAQVEHNRRLLREGLALRRPDPAAGRPA